MKLTDEFILGLIVGEGCFSFSNRPGRLFSAKEKIPAFILRMHVRDKKLVIAVRDTLKLNDNKIYEYTHNKRHYIMLIIRNTGDIKNIIIPFFYKRLKGYKKKQFNQWLEDFNKPEVAEGYKFIYRLYKNGYYSRFKGYF